MGLGFATYESHEGERRMAIRWRLERPIPASWLPGCSSASLALAVLGMLSLRFNWPEAMDTAAPLLTLLVDRMEPLSELYARDGVHRLEVFGSAAKGCFNTASSDLDFIVKITGQKEPGYARRFCSFADAMEDLFGRPVDLLTESKIRNPCFRQDMEASRRLLLEV